MTTSVRPPPPTRASEVSAAAQEQAARAWDVGVVVAANAVVVVALWLRHGGLNTLQGPGGTFTAVGQLTGLIGTYAVLSEILLMSRIGWLERFVGFDRLAVWHRWTGFAAVSLLLAHAVFITLGYAESGHQSVWSQLVDFIRHYPDVLMSIVGLALLVAVGAASLRAARQRLTRETWYAIHLYAYLAVALSFAHQVAVGSDFSNDRLARAWWIALYLGVFAAVLSWRVGRPVVFNARHRLFVVAVRREAAGVASIYVGGRHLEEVRATAGQFFLWRFLTSEGWAKAHPFSLSAAPNRDFLRITVKDLGDDTRRMLTLRPGVRVFAEGPYGTFTVQRRTRPRVALIAGGIGITPLRALLESLPRSRGDITLLYRAETVEDIAFRDELDVLTERYGVEVHYLIGSEIGDDQTDQLGIPALQRHCPDIRDRDVFVCGPPAMLSAVRRRLAALHVPRSHVHFERFDY
jgi:predicted ferric reductase